MFYPFELKPYLFPRGQAGLCCDAEGVALGPVALVEKSNAVLGKRYRICPPEVFVKAFFAAYGRPPFELVQYLWEGIGRVTKSLEDGDVHLAVMKAIHLTFPEIEAENMAKLAISELAKAGFNPDEPRDEFGRWTSDGAADGMEQVVVTAHRMPSNTPSKTVPRMAPTQWASIAPPPGTNKVASVSVDPAQGFVTPAKAVEFSVMNDELRVVTTGGGGLVRRDGKNGYGSILPVGALIMWGNIYDSKPVTGNERPIGYFREPVGIINGKAEETIIKISHTGYIKAYVQGIDTTLPNTKVDIYN